MLCLAPSAWAQEQTGSVEGVVRDQQHAVVGRASVEARNLAVGSALETITDGAGRFRFAALTPGAYDVTASLDGFRPTRFERVEILLGQIKRLDFILLVGPVTETVNASAASPLLDVTQSAHGFSLRENQLAYLPRGPDYTSVLRQLPGTNLEPKLGGISVDGSSAAENRFLIDGIDTTNALSGLPGQFLNVDTVEEVQLKSTGYAAEYGGTTGGGRQRGDEEWHERLARRREGLLYGERARRGRAADTPAECGGLVASGVRHVSKGSVRRVRARLQRRRTDQARSRLVLRGLRTAADAHRAHGHVCPRRIVGNLRPGRHPSSRDSEPDAAARAAAADAGLVQRGADAHRGPAARAHRHGFPLSNFGVVTHEPSWMATGTVNFLATSRLLLSGRAGYTLSDLHTDNVRSDPGYIFQFSNVGLLDVPESLQRVTGFTTDTNNFGVVKDRVSRIATEMDATWYVSRLGTHTLKSGVQADWTTNDTNKGLQANAVGLFWDRSLQDQRGTYGFYQVASNSIDPRRGSVFIGRAQGRTAGMFVQDAWTVGQRLTLNVGLRTERETVPRYARPGGDTSPIIEFGFDQKLAPRLGAAYDLRGDGLWKIYGSWGVFYDIFKYTLSTAFGGLDTVTYSFTLDTPNWPTLLASPACPPACPGTLISTTSQVNDDTSPIDPGLDPMRLQEAVAGVEHQMRRNLLLSARYVHKQVDRAIEDIGTRDADANEIYTVGNPGFGRAASLFPDAPSAGSLPLPKAVRNYDAIEVAMRRLIANRWGFGLSYIWSRLFGNYSGLSQSDSNGGVAPNLGQLYDYPLIMFNERGQPVYGRLATDRPHQLKGNLLYSTSFGLTAGAFQYISSGLPVTRVAIVLPPSDYPMQYLGRMSEGRTPMLSQTDVYVQQDIAQRRGARLSVSVGVINLFNEDTVIARFSLETEPGAGLAIDEAALYAGRLDFKRMYAEQQVLRDPRFLMPRDFQAPRTARIMLKWSF